MLSVEYISTNFDTFEEPAKNLPYFLALLFFIFWCTFCIAFSIKVWMMSCFYSVLKICSSTCLYAVSRCPITVKNSTESAHWSRSTLCTTSTSASASENWARVTATVTSGLFLLIKKVSHAPETKFNQICTFS